MLLRQSRASLSSTLLLVWTGLNVAIRGSDAHADASFVFSTSLLADSTRAVRQVLLGLFFLVEETSCSLLINTANYLLVTTYSVDGYLLSVENNNLHGPLISDSGTVEMAESYGILIKLTIYAQWLKR